MTNPSLTPAALTQLLNDNIPQAKEQNFSVEAVENGTCRIRLPVNQMLSRPGGTISGPTMMGLADAAMWIAVMSNIGEALMAVTTNLNINFLRKPEMKDLIAEGSTLKLGKRLAVLEVSIYSDGQPDDPVAHVTGTYSIPPRS